MSATPAGGFVQLTTTHLNTLLAVSVAVSKDWSVAEPVFGRTYNDHTSKRTVFHPSTADAAAIRRCVGHLSDGPVTVAWREYEDHDPTDGLYRDAVLDVNADGALLTYIEHDEPGEALIGLIAELDEFWRA